MHRIKVDLKDLDIGACPGLGVNSVDWASVEVGGARREADRKSAAAAAGGAAGSGEAATMGVEGSVGAGAGVGEGPRRWLCIGKHLCGAATDYALRACLEAAGQAGEESARKVGGEGADAATSDAVAAPEEAGGRKVAGEGAEEAAGKASGGAEEAAWQAAAAVRAALHGLAIAPCCHHR